MKGVVLKTIPYQDSGRIVQLYTEECGLISLLIKRLSPKNTHLQNIISPLSFSDYQLVKSKNDLYYLQDATLIDPFIELRRNLDRLMSAQVMINMLLKSQSNTRASTPLFKLFVNYLKALKETQNPKNYALSFACKILRVEGVFPLDKEDIGYPFKDDEWEALTELAYATSHDAISEIKLPHKIEEKFYSIFSDLVTSQH